MAQIIAPDVCRYSVNQTYNSRPTVNVIDMVVLDQSGGTFSRDDAVNATAGDILDAWDQYVLPCQSASLQALSVSWVDLNDLDGSVGSISSTTDSTWPAFGTVTGQGLPANVSCLVTKRTNSRRSSRDGRMFLGGLAEASTDGSYIPTATLNTWITRFGDFTEALTETGTISVYQNFPTVVHTRNEGTPTNPDIVYTGNTQITSFAPQPLLATQRRRLRR